MALVFETDLLKCHLAAYAFPRQATAAVGDVGFGMKQIEHARCRGHGPLVEVDGLAQAGQRPQQSLGHEDHDAVGADV